MTSTDRFAEFGKMRPWELITLSRRDPSTKSEIIAYKLPISQYQIRLLGCSSKLDLTFSNGQKIEWTFYPISEKKPEYSQLGTRNISDTVFLVHSYHEKPVDEFIKEMKYCFEIFKVEGSCKHFSMDFSQVGCFEKLSSIVSEFPNVHFTMRKFEEKHLGNVLGKMKIGKQLGMVSYPSTENPKDPSEDIETMPSTTPIDSSDPFCHLSSISSSGLNAFLKLWTASSDTSKRSFNILTGDFLDRNLILEGLKTKPFDEEIDYYSFHYTPTRENAVKITNSVGISATVVVNIVADDQRYFVFMVDGSYDNI